VEVEGGGIAEDNQIDFIAFQETSYAFYQPVIMADVAEGFIYHYRVADGIFQ
jgi:hypothetical protein